MPDDQMVRLLKELALEIDALDVDMRRAGEAGKTQKAHVEEAVRRYIRDERARLARKQEGQGDG